MLQINFEKAIKYPFVNQNWITKLLTAGLVLIIPIFGIFVVLGWMFRIIKEIINGHDTDVPEIRFVEDLIIGLKGVVLILPFLLAQVVLNLAIEFINSSFPKGGMVVEQSIGILLLSLVINVVSMVISVFSIVALPIMYGLFARNNFDIRAAFNFEKILSMLSSSKSFLSVFIVSFICGIIVNIWAFLGILFCFVGLLITLPISAATSANLYGQLFAQLEKKEV